MSSLPEPPRPPRPGPGHRLGLPAGLCALALLAGCGLLPPAPQPAPAAAPTPAPAPAHSPVPAAPAPAPTPEPAEARSADPADLAARRLLAAHERLREPGAAELLREATRQADPAEPEARIELALALAQTRQNGDLARAVALLDPLVRQPTPAAWAPWAPFARLLHARLTEQRRLEELNERQAQQLREQQRRLDQLASQIDALRAIERSLNTRPAAPAAAPR